MSGPKRRDATERFMEKIEKSNGCWLWRGAVGADGYGRFYLDPENKSARAHRVSHLLLIGPIGDGYLVLHRCDTPLCVRPDHLYLGDAAQNMRDKAERNQDWNPMSRKTHCANGHEFTEENTRIRKGRYQRICRACERSSVKRYYERKAKQ